MTDPHKPDIFQRTTKNPCTVEPDDPYEVIPDETPQERRRRLDRARKKRARQQAKEAKAKAKAASENQPNIDQTTPSKRARIREMRQRIDGKLGGQKVSAEARKVIQEAVETYYDVPFSTIAKVTGFSHQTVRSVVGESPELLLALASKRRADTLARMELTLSEMMAQLEDAVFRADLRPTVKTFRDWTVAFGILFDKRSMLSGDERGDQLTDEDFASMRNRMINAIDGAHETLKVIQGGHGRRTAK